MVTPTKAPSPTINAPRRDAIQGLPADDPNPVQGGANVRQDLMLFIEGSNSLYWLRPPFFAE